MLSDIVIDTNVLVHSNNPNEQRYEDCCTLLEDLLDSSTKLGVDEGFSINQSDNRSYIGSEYINNINHGSLAFSVLSTLAASKRILFYPKRASRNEQRIINQTIRNRVDRVFLGVSFNSEEKIFVSHDYEDFQEPKRVFISKEIDVEIIEARESLTLI